MVIDFKNVFGETNPAITALYKTLRTSYMGKVKTKRPITQAYLALASENNPEELQIIQTHFQNWGTPENNRIRPHFTLSYNYSCERAAAEGALKDFVIPESLRVIKFTHLGIVAIDIWGNPLNNGIIHAVPLNP